MRSYVQLVFFIVIIWIGVEFFLFMRGLENGVSAASARPPGVEGFLPISALMSLRYFVLTGTVNRIHPAGLFIFVAAITISTFMKKGFCSWICPVGYVSESLHELGNKLFGRNFRPHRWIDVPLRGVKYFMLAFFLVAVSTMSVLDLRGFIFSDYNKAADMKLFTFFAHLSAFSVVVIGALLVLSIFYKNFWCRYACPYGALLGLTGLLSPLRIYREDRTCVDCGKCEAACPSHLPVDKLGSVNSVECTACYSCVEACPIKNTMKLSVSAGSRGVSQREYALILTSVYLGIVGIAMLAGLWQNSISGSEYLSLFRSLDTLSHAF